MMIYGGFPNISPKYDLIYGALAFLGITLSPLTLEACRDVPVMFGLLFGGIAGWFVWNCVLSLIFALNKATDAKRLKNLSAQQLMHRAEVARGLGAEVEREVAIAVGEYRVMPKATDVSEFTFSPEAQASSANGDEGILPAIAFEREALSADLTENNILHSRRKRENRESEKQTQTLIS